MRIIRFFFYIISFFYNKKVSIKWSHLKNRLYTYWNHRFFKSMGNSILIYPLSTTGEKRITIGDESLVGRYTVLAAHTDNATIEIGDRCCIGEFSNIQSCNHIKIGNGVRTGRRIMINDTSHGGFEREQLDIQPNLRPLVSKGPIIIEDNVWIGENTCVMANVHIGKGSIIGAGSVVTKDIPPYSLAVGNPARVIKSFLE